jgi:hypothetical protein
MAAPRHGLGAHEHDSLARYLFDEGGQIFCEFRGLHAVGETAEGNLSPAHVQRPRVRVTEPSQTGNLRIADAGNLQRGGECVAVELRLWRERGTVRTSTSRLTEWAANKAINSASGRVEWPTVNTRGGEFCFTIIFRFLRRA